MKNIEIFDYDSWQLLGFLGINHPYLAIHKTTVIATWVVLALLIIISAVVQYGLRTKRPVISFVTREFVTSFIELCEQSLGTFHAGHCAVIISFFLFIFLCNSITIIPFVEEPTKDLNTTLALGIISFLYIQINSIRQHGVKEYLKEYFSPFFIMFPLHVIGKVASIISISFRLFGNIFGGAVIMNIFQSAIQGSFVLEFLSMLGPQWIMTSFFGLFEGFLQAFVFSMLSLTYLAMALQHAGDEQ